MTHSKTDNISNSCSLKLVIENDHYLYRFSQAHNIFLQDNEHFQATKTYIQRDYNPWTVKPMLSLLRKYVLVTGSVGSKVKFQIPLKVPFLLLEFFCYHVEKLLQIQILLLIIMSVQLILDIQFCLYQ